MRARTWDWIALTLVVIGAINWGLIGFFQFDIIAAIFGGVGGWATRVLYSLIGIAGLYCVSLYRLFDTSRAERHDHDRLAQ
ncbi:MAG: DUF378 domain-containing protein [Clostridiales bacterium]|jgi:uncharacterized membrane protein YuzA (DUF378 family)|nr:DUF378 domain-containing protein [Clostridiales bacterium]